MISRATHECDILVVWLNAVSGGCIAVRGDHSALTTRNMFKPSTMELLTQLRGLGSKYLVAHPPAVLTLLARHLGVEHPLVVVWGERHHYHHHHHYHRRLLTYGVRLLQVELVHLHVREVCVVEAGAQV